MKNPHFQQMTSISQLVKISTKVMSSVSAQIHKVLPYLINWSYGLEFSTQIATETQKPHIECSK